MGKDTVSRRLRASLNAGSRFTARLGVSCVVVEMLFLFLFHYRLVTSDSARAKKAWQR